MNNLTTVLSQNLPDFSTAQIEAGLRCGYQRPTLRDPVAESGTWPPFIQPFYIWLAEHKTIPTPNQHLALYFALYPTADNGHRPGLEARILRAWPSLVRDQHLVALLREAGMTVTYGLDWDRLGGVDVAVWPPLEGRPPLFVHAFVASARARAYRARKVQGPRHFDLPLVRGEAKVVGDVWLYQTPLHTERVRVAL
jgi:hypothetical protein